MILFGLPSLLRIRTLRRRGWGWSRARAEVGLQIGTARAYLLALALIPIGTAIGTALLRVIPSGLLHGHDRNITGAPSNFGGYMAIVLLALAEELLFRGFATPLLVKRWGFRQGNAIQAALFLAPHLLLLLVSIDLWPILPLQLLAGWVLGWLRHRSHSIGPGWLLHAATNALAAALI